MLVSDKDLRKAAINTEFMRKLLAKIKAEKLRTKKPTA
jgi:hypothetical protein